MTQESCSSSKMRVTSASVSPSCRAFACCSSRQLAGEDRDEDHVVDAEHDLERRSA
jgi:hypothetical protein